MQKKTQVKPVEALERGSAGAELLGDQVPVSVGAHQGQLLQLRVLTFGPRLTVDSWMQKVLPHQPGMVLNNVS